MIYHVGNHLPVANLWSPLSTLYQNGSRHQPMSFAERTGALPDICLFFGK
jgi:hypothetical protein